MKTIDKKTALEMIEAAGLKPMLPYRGYAVQVGEQTIGIKNDGTILLYKGKVTRCPGCGCDWTGSDLCPDCTSVRMRIAEEMRPDNLRFAENPEL